MVPNRSTNWTRQGLTSLSRRDGAVIVVWSFLPAPHRWHLTPLLSLKINAFNQCRYTGTLVRHHHHHHPDLATLILLAHPHGDSAGADDLGPPIHVQVKHWPPFEVPARSHPLSVVKKRLH